MADTGRESFLGKLRRQFKPQSEKTTSEKVKDSVKDKTEAVASAVTPASKKSNQQKVVDAVDPSSHESKTTKLRNRLSFRAKKMNEPTPKKEETSEPANITEPAHD